MAHRYEAYLFDVQGTLVDFFGPVTRAVADHAARAGVVVDVAGLVRRWRGEYFDRVGRLDQSTADWTPVAEVYADGLRAVAPEFGLPLADEDIGHLAAAWAHLEPWPDVAPGIERLRDGALVATLSNADMSTMVRLFKAVGIDWDAVLTAEVFGAFKPAPVTYLGALRFLGVAPERAAMVAAHPYDLRAAAAVGLHTVFIDRPQEFGDPALAPGAAGDAGLAEFDHRVAAVTDIP